MKKTEKQKAKEEAFEEAERFKTLPFKELVIAEEQEVRPDSSISMWKLNKGQCPVQVFEYEFIGSVSDDKFYISHDGNCVYFFIEAEELNVKSLEGMSITARRLVILKLEDLSLIKTFDLPASIKMTSID